MPFKSASQRRLFYAKAHRGEMPMETVEKWEEETPKGKKLPERVSNRRTKKRTTKPRGIKRGKKSNKKRPKGAKRSTKRNK